jgi:hypothetical protein
MRQLLPATAQAVAGAAQAQDSAATQANNPLADSTAFNLQNYIGE